MAQMKAAVVQAFGRPLEIGDIEGRIVMRIGA